MPGRTASSELLYILRYSSGTHLTDLDVSCHHSKLIKRSEKDVGIPTSSHHTEAQKAQLEATAAIGKEMQKGHSWGQSPQHDATSNVRSEVN